jgi:hypothetical protein
VEQDKTKILIEEMIDLCTSLGDETLSQAASGIYGDLQAARNLEVLMTSARELMVFVSEADWTDCEDLKYDVEIIYTRLSEEYDDF